MQDKYKITKEEIIEAARSMLGVKFRHQGRDKKRGVDCVGFVIEIAKELKYPFIFDKPNYERIPSEETALKYLRKSAIEIEKKEIQDGDLMSMISAGRETHVGVKINDYWFIHAKSNGFGGEVRFDKIKEYQHLIKRGFRLKGVK